VDFGLSRLIDRRSTACGRLRVLLSLSRVLYIFLTCVNFFNFYIFFLYFLNLLEFDSLSSPNELKMITLYSGSLGSGVDEERS
jgi:hypothetical protein